jgi:D-alanine-D-alanine ligase
MRLPDKVAIVVNRPEESNVALGEEAVHDVMYSAEAAEEALCAAGCKVEIVGIGSSPAEFLQELEKANPQFVVNLAEEAWGSDRFEPAVAYLLAIRGLPFTGNPPETLTACRDKWNARLIASAAGLLIGRGVVFRKKPASPTCLPYAAIVKPSCHDGSIGITIDSVVAAGSDANAAVEACASHGGFPVLVEEYFPGRELNVTLAEREDGTWTVAPSELDYSGVPDGRPRILSYNGKWIEGSLEDQQTVVHTKLELDKELDAKVQRASQAMIEAFGLRGYARYDARLDDKGDLRVIDINPNPDIAPCAGVSRALQAIGLEHPDFIREQVAIAWRRRKGEM